MKVLLLCGSHPRHEYLLRNIIRNSPDTQFKIFMMRRESIIPKFPPKDMAPTPSQESLFFRHFKAREATESERFGVENVKVYQHQRNVIFQEVGKEEINSNPIQKSMVAFKADVCISMGYGMLNQATLSILPGETFNVHLGLSPKYRGSATLFWPTYFLDPFSTGVTFHRMNLQPDAGNIIHQSLPLFKRNFTLHMTAVEAITEASKDIEKLYEKISNKREIIEFEQPIVGKTFLTSDFRIAHLEIIYNLYNDQIMSYVWPQDNVLQLPKIRRQNFE